MSSTNKSFEYRLLINAFEYRLLINVFNQPDLRVLSVTLRIGEVRLGTQ